MKSFSEDSDALHVERMPIDWMPNNMQGLNYMEQRKTIAGLDKQE